MFCARQEEPKGEAGRTEPLYILFVSKWLKASQSLGQTHSLGTARAIAEGKRYYLGVQSIWIHEKSDLFYLFCSLGKLVLILCFAKRFGVSAR